MNGLNAIQFAVARAIFNAQFNAPKRTKSSAQKLQFFANHL